MTSKDDKDKAMFGDIRRPDFFIVGAPKSGTTAMNDFLRQHPQIFIFAVRALATTGIYLFSQRPRGHYV
jgi:hypothetical protein